MLPRLILMLCLVVQPVLGWWAAGVARAGDEPSESCCCPVVEVESCATSCQPSRGCAPEPGRSAAGVEVQRLLTSGPRVLRVAERDVEGRGPIARSPRWAAGGKAVRGCSARPRPARDIRPVLCVWVI